MSEVESLALELLNHDDLPELYKAKMHAYLSSRDGFDWIECLDAATACMSKAKAELGTSCCFRQSAV